MDPLSLASYDYTLPKECIAIEPIRPKEAAKLLVFRRKDSTITHSTFRDFASFLPKDTLLVFNNTKVLSARIYGEKLLNYPLNQRGAKIEALFHKELSNNRYLMQFKGRLKPNNTIAFDNVYARILKDSTHFGIGFKEAEFFTLQANKEIPLSRDDFFTFLEHSGHIPLPPYIKRSDTIADKEDYQSVFAKHLGAIAAPTASLHFSKSAYTELNKHFNTTEITLHTGAGTFIGVSVENILEHAMHTESFFISEDSARKLKEAKHITAIGTTTARTIETYVRSNAFNKGEALSGECDLFLHPKNPPKATHALLTNFHLPKTTLLMLVASFVGLEQTLSIYQEAIAHNYRFYSYGDGMLIL
ncbi:tRNA preQ1(34) S-adenosylmethionine ribosyltransferase-isomerase QueA [Helicobacter turcicus]|uniref:S-adenosylmethionine:tRNA ribosyltransferase-isomerase n=1 Tax=Helicobacter turcicus TaxID=2867412 RepID=A0ABS7JND4_9HELI|nr:tRNA preQ1(34) S-adenosylmethionine ribosyltransferase-isomerase QueA [Helicobacter turcicus]MBX7490911.1 tRNA preQ1(34) S-adenosylmethionine ribosyltransferase-isomerase QueA [Helicobacter turcicus]MBX7545765.1 tRNA preQ1(34) S-adenosylmethionine ribosyltransferase-isomerase QueA [Helicobacter turcicus]